MENDNNQINELCHIFREAGDGDVIRWREIERALGGSRGEKDFERRLKKARQRLVRDNILVDGYGPAKGVGLRRLASEELFEKTGKHIRQIYRSAKRTVTTCGVAAAKTRSNSETRIIAGRAAIASRVMESTTARAVQNEIEKDHAPPLSPKEIWAMKKKAS